ILDCPGQHFDQFTLVHCVKVFLQVHIHYILISLLDIVLTFLDGIVSTPFGSEAEAVLGELLLVDRRKYLSYGLLDHSVHDRRYSQVSFLLSVIFWYFYPTDGIWTELTLQNGLPDYLSVLFEIL